MKRNARSRGSPLSGPVRLEEALVAVVQREIESDRIREDVWETAVRLNNGDDGRAVGSYIRLRFRKTR